MKRTSLFLVVLSFGLMLAGFGPRPYSDLAEYRRLPLETRINRMQSAGEDLFMRRHYEDAIVVFETILTLDPGDLKAKLWVTKAQSQILVEKNEATKKALYQKYGHLTPKDKIYENWHWGPSVGHFEVRYSEPKPYVPKVRKLRPKATDAEIAAAKKKAEASGDAADLFELAMLYWSIKDRDKSLKAFFDAFAVDPEILSKDDEYMLSTISEEVDAKAAAGKAAANDYLVSGRLGLIQGDRQRAVNHLVKAAALDEKIRETVRKELATFVATSQVEMVSLPADIFSFRQAYVFDKGTDKLYLRIVMVPKNGSQVIPVDMMLNPESVKDIELASKDVAFAFTQPGIDDSSSRLYLILPEKEGEFPEYEVRVALTLDRAESQSFELSNFSLSQELPDNWSFVISSEYNVSESLAQGDFEKSIDGMKITGWHLAITEGKGPYIPLDSFKEPLPKAVDVWKIIETGGETSLQASF
ncbi:MAG: hypothetical protein PHD82_02170 [Candidatus Riflebacteria bacterium]|nr:hypothetical protein [Candidatus Riflebacteria bacterium]